MKCSQIIVNLRFQGEALLYKKNLFDFEWFS